MTGQFPQKRVYPHSALYGLKADPIDTGTASVGTDKPPGMSEDIRSADLVVERVKAIGRFLLGLDIYSFLCSVLIVAGVVSAMAIP